MFFDWPIFNFYIVMWFKIKCLDVKVTRVWIFSGYFMLFNLVGLTNRRYISEACTWVHLWRYCYKRLIVWKIVSQILADECHVLAPGLNKMKRRKGDETQHFQLSVSTEMWANILCYNCCKLFLPTSSYSHNGLYLLKLQTRMFLSSLILFLLRYVAVMMRKVANAYS